MSLIKIEKDGQELVLYPGTKIKFILKSPLFLYEPAPASRSLSFRVPAEPNDQLLTLTRLPDNRAKKWEIEGFRISLGGNFWKTAKLIVTKIKKEEYEIQLLLDKGYIAKSGQKKLQELNYYKTNLHSNYRLFTNSLERDEIEFDPIIDTTVSFELEVTLSRGVIDWVYKINYNQSNLEIYIDKICKTINQDSDSHKYVAIRSGVFLILNSISDSFGGYVLTPSSLDITWQTPVEYRVAGINPPQSMAASINDTLTEDCNTSDVVFFPIKNPDYFGENQTLIPVVADNYNFVNPIMNIGNTSGGVLLKYRSTYTPFLYLKNVLFDINKNLGFNVEDNFFDTELSTLVIYNTYDLTYLFKVIGFSNFGIVPYFKIHDTLPEITLSEFITSIQNLFCTILDYNTGSNVVRYLKRKDILQFSSDQDWTDKVIPFFIGSSENSIIELNYTFDPKEKLVQELLKEKDNLETSTQVNFKANLPTSGDEKNTIRLVKVENKFYLVVLDSTDTWQLLSEDLYKYKVSNSPNLAINTNCSTLFSIVEETGIIPLNTAYKYLGLYPYTKQIGKSKLSGIPSDKFALRLLFYRGIVSQAKINIETGAITSDSTEYPLGHYNNFDLLNNQLGEYSLKWNGDYGLHEKFWKEWVEWLATAERYEWEVSLAYFDLLTIDMLKPKRIKNQLYFIDEIEVDIGDTISPATITSYKR